MSTRGKLPSSAIAIGVCFIFATATSAEALTIIDNFDSTITGATNAASIESTINTASSSIASLYTNNFSVTINFGLAGGGVLGQSSQNFYTGVSYSTYVGALTADARANPQNSILATAVANLSSGNGAPGSATAGYTMAINTALANLLAPYAPWSVPAASGNITLSDSLLTDPTIYWGTGSTPAGQYSGTAVVEHEIDEILGGGGAGSMVGATGPFANNLGSLDLYRYSAAGTPSFTTSSSATAYFSVNGGVSTPGSSNLVDFNQSGTGDYGDFTGTCDIQNYAGCTGHTPETFAGSIESSMLQSIGYDLAAPSPAPGAGAWSLVALLLAGAARRLRGA